MTLTQASAKAGESLETVGDGVSTSVPVPTNAPYLYIHAAAGYPVSCVGAEINGDSTIQIVETPEGFRLGDSVAHLRAVYGTSARYEPASLGGIDPQAGYVVFERGGDLVFKTDASNTKIVGIAGGPTGLTPSQCDG